VNLRVNSPELFSFAKNKFISVAKAWNQNSPNQLLHLPILDIAYDQFQDLSLRMTDRQLAEDKDSCTYSWGRISYLQELTKLWLAIIRFMYPSTGHGTASVHPSTKFSSDYTHQG